MTDPTVGWIAAIIIGGIAGWLAEQFMKSDMGMLMNIVLGIVGAAVASAILSYFGIVLGGWLGYLIAGFIGACLLIWIVRLDTGCSPGSLRTAIKATPSQITVSKNIPALFSCAAPVGAGPCGRVLCSAASGIAPAGPP